MIRFKSIPALLAGFCVISFPAHACTMTSQERQALFVSYDRNGDQKLDALEYQTGETARFGQSAVDQQALRIRFDAMGGAGKGWVGPESFEPIPDPNCMQEGRIAY